MRRLVIYAGIAIWSISSNAAVPAILLEACNAMDPASKRMECLRAANQTGSPSNGGVTSSGTASQSAYAPQTNRAAPARPTTASNGATCYVGPRGGPYTITASGRKNYGGC